MLSFNCPLVLAFLLRNHSKKVTLTQQFIVFTALLINSFPEKHVGIDYTFFYSPSGKTRYESTKVHSGEPRSPWPSVRSIHGGWLVRVWMFLLQQVAPAKPLLSWIWDSLKPHGWKPLLPPPQCVWSSLSLMPCAVNTLVHTVGYKEWPDTQIKGLVTLPAMRACKQSRSLGKMTFAKRPTWTLQDGSLVWVIVIPTRFLKEKLLEQRQINTLDTI